MSQRPTERPKQPTEEIKTVDLTKAPKSKRPIFQSILQVGSSILKSVKKNEMKKNTAVLSFPGTGARIENCRLMVSGLLPRESVNLDP